ATVTSASPTSLSVTAPASSGVITVTVGGVTAGSSAAFAGTSTYSGNIQDNSSSNLSGATISVVENPLLTNGPTDSSGVYNLIVPARPYFSLLLSKPGFYPTCTA